MVITKQEFIDDRDVFIENIPKDAIIRFPDCDFIDIEAKYLLEYSKRDNIYVTTESKYANRKGNS